MPKPLTPQEALVHQEALDQLRLAVRDFHAADDARDVAKVRMDQAIYRAMTLGVARPKVTREAPYSGTWVNQIVEIYRAREEARAAS